MKIPRDKKMHFGAGMFLAMLFGWIYWWLGLLAAVAYGIGKEVYDYHHQDTHTPEVLDAVATILGGLVGVGVVIVTLGV